MLLENERLASLIELAVAEYPDQERIERFLRCGAAFHVRPTRDGMVDIGLRFTESSGDLANARAACWAGVPDVPTPEERAETLLLKRVHAVVLTTPPQG